MREVGTRRGRLSFARLRWAGSPLLVGESKRRPRRATAGRETKRARPTDKGSVKARPVRVLGWLVLALFVIWAVYVIAAGVFLRGAKLQDYANSKPDRFYIEWGDSMSWFPGVVRARGVTIIGQGSRSVYYVKVRDVSFKVGILPLFRKTIRVDRFKAEGVDFRLAKPIPRDGQVPEEFRNHPPIPGLERLPRRAAPRSGPRAPSWKIKADDIRLGEVEEVWIFGERLLGPGQLQGALDMQVGGPFRVVSKGFELGAGVFIHEGVAAASNMVFRLTGDMGPIVFGIEDLSGSKAFNHFSARVGIRGDLLEVSLLRERLGNQNYIDFRGGGRINADVGLDRGYLSPESELMIEAPHLKVVAGEFAFEGDAKIEDRIGNDDGDDGAVASMSVTMSDLSVRHRGELIGRGAGRALELRSASRTLRADGWFTDADLSLRVSGLTLPEGAWLNQYLPSGTDVQVTRGALRAGGIFQATGQRAAGMFQIDADPLGLEVNGLQYEARLAVEAQYATDSLEDGTFRVGGSLVLTNIQAPGLSPKRADGWHLTLRVREGEVAVSSNDWTMASVLRVEMKDTRPILAVLGEQKDAPRWLWLAPTLRDVQGGAEVTLTPGIAEFRNVTLDAAATEMRAQLRAETNGLRGIAYVRYGIVSAGFDLRSEDRGWRVFGAKRWYERALGSPFRPREEE
jgi:hypothetical protein